MFLIRGALNEATLLDERSGVKGDRAPASAGTAGAVGRSPGDFRDRRHTRGWGALARLPSTCALYYDLQSLQLLEPAGIWLGIFQALTGSSGVWDTVAIDASYVKSHRSAAGAKGCLRASDRHRGRAHEQIPVRGSMTTAVPIADESPN
jgi:hypothetical protein